MAELALTPLSPGTLTLVLVTPAAGSLTGPSGLDLAVFKSDLTGWDFRKYITLGESGDTNDRLTILSGTALASHAGNYTTAAGTTLFEVDDLGNVLFGDNILLATRTGDTESNIADFAWLAKYRRLYTRNLVLREMGDPVDLRIGRAGNDNTYPYGSPQGSIYGLLSGQPMGAIVFEGAVTPLGGTPGVTAGATFRTWSAGIRGVPTENLIRGAVNDLLGGKLEFLTTDNGTETQDIRMTIDHDGRVIVATPGGKTTLQLTDTGADTGLTIGGDTNLFRSAANVLKTDDSFHSGGANITARAGLPEEVKIGNVAGTRGGIVFGSSGTESIYSIAANVLATDDRFIIRVGTAGSSAFGVSVTGDAEEGFTIEGGGLLKWSDRASAWDFSVGRISANKGGTSAGDSWYVGDELEVDGALNHDGTTIGFYGVTPVARSAAYTPTNVTTDRAFDADTVVVAELADVVGTLIADLRATGIIG